MRQDNRAIFSVRFLLLVVAFTSIDAFAGPQDISGLTEANDQVKPITLPSDVDPSDPALPVWMRPTIPSSSEKNTNAVAADTTGIVSNTAQAAPGRVVKGANGGYEIVTHVENVTLPVTVVDDRHQPVTDLKANDFAVYEDDQPQNIIQFTNDDIPVSIGILVDNSGSMREKRPAVTKAVLNLVKASNKDDEVFIVNFNDDSYLDQDFTNELGLMQEALERLDSRGGTALYDAVIASTDHLSNSAKLAKKVLLVVTDGEDNESSKTLEQAIRAVQDEHGPMIYTIGILGHEGKERRARRALEALSLQTGGVAFFPKNLEEVDAVSQQVARDIRNQYTIVYKSNNRAGNTQFRHVRVVARGSGHRELTVRTKTGYFAEKQRTSASK